MIPPQPLDIPDSLPIEPDYYSIEWSKHVDWYCLPVEQAKNLLKNTELMKAYQQELKIELEKHKH